MPSFLRILKSRYLVSTKNLSAVLSVQIVAMMEADSSELLKVGEGERCGRVAFTNAQIAGTFSRTPKWRLNSYMDQGQGTKDDLLAAAQAYHELGVPVIPFKLTLKESGEYDKKPLVQWAKWETEPQTDAEFDALSWSDANALGVILGTLTKGGLYLAVVDYDVKGNLSEDAKAKGLELLKELPTTQTQRTVNKGLHQVYWTRTKPKTDGTFHENACLELLGANKCCLMVPSMGYKNVNDNPPTEVESISDVFYGVLRKHGFKLSEETETQNQIDVYSFQLDKLVDLSKLNKTGTDEYQGPHPFHDSTTEKNFHVNVRTNQWYCFRHSSGGGALQYLAMKEGIIECEQAKKGALRGGKFKKVLQVAASQGLIDEKLLTQSEINPIILAKDIKEDYVFIVDKDSGVLYYYEKEGIYSDKTEQLLKREIVRRLDENTKAHYYVEIENFILHSAPLVEMNSYPELIAVSNGVLNVLTRELNPFNPDYYLTQKLGVKYEADAQCPAVPKFLIEILPEEKQRQTVQEYVGYVLYRKITYHVCLLLVGLGRNGKSVLLELVTALVGKDNVSSQTIQSLCYNRFSLAELHNKLVNVSADLPSKELTNTGNFKMIVGGDRLPGEHKHKDPFYFDNYAKLMFSCNRIPPTPSTEACLAFYSRFKILEFKNTFTGKKADKHLIDKLTTPDELSGFLNYVLEGLKRLEERQDFTETMTQEETEKAYIKLSNSAQAFIMEKVTVTDEHSDYVFDDVLYRDFITYCHTEKLQTLPKAAFTKAMQEFCPGAEHTRINVEQESQRKGKYSYSKAPAWRFIKTGQFGQFRQPSGKYQAQCEKCLISYAEKIVSEPCLKCLNCLKPEERIVCGHCHKWHTGACNFPGDPNCVAPLNTFAKTCPDYEEQEASEA